jgi:hypothetical protein
MDTCRSCGSSDIVSIEMNVGDQKVTFIACHRCDSKAWERDGEAIELDEVLNRNSQG